MSIRNRMHGTTQHISTRLRWSSMYVYLYILGEAILIEDIPTYQWSWACTHVMSDTLPG